MMKRILWVILGMGVAAGPLWAQAGKSAPKPAAKPRAEAAGRSLLNPASLKAKAPDVYKVKFTTTKGDFVVQVTRAWAPLGADRFYNLIQNGFYNDAAFFRVIKGFMVQFGISANPAVARVWHSANIKDDPVKQSNHPSYL